MKWPWRTREPSRPSVDATESERIALRGLTDARAQREQVEDLARRLNDARAKNHFGEAVTRAIRGDL